MCYKGSVSGIYLWHTFATAGDSFWNFSVEINSLSKIELLNLQPNAFCDREGSSCQTYAESSLSAVHYYNGSRRRNRCENLHLQAAYQDAQTPCSTLSDSTCTQFMPLLMTLRLLPLAHAF